MKDKMIGKFGWVQAATLATVLTTSLAMATTSFAAPQKPAGKGAGKGGPGGRGGMRGGPMRMMKELNLTAAQQTKIKAIMEASRPQMKALRENTKLSEQDKHAQMMKMRKAQMEKINAVLTPAQRTKFAAMQKEMREKMKNMKPGDRPGGPR